MAPREGNAQERRDHRRLTLLPDSLAPTPAEEFSVVLSKQDRLKILNAKALGRASLDEVVRLWLSVLRCDSIDLFWRFRAAENLADRCGLPRGAHFTDSTGAEVTADTILAALRKYGEERDGRVVPIHAVVVTPGPKGTVMGNRADSIIGAAVASAGACVGPQGEGTQGVGGTRGP